MNHLDNLFHGFFLAFLVLLTVLFLFNFSQIAALKDIISSGDVQLKSNDIQNTIPTDFAGDSNSEIDKREIEKLIEERLASMQSEPLDYESALTPTPLTSSEPRDFDTLYIPLGSTGSTTSTEWTTLPDAVAVVDAKTDYEDGAYIQFEAFLKVDYGSGTGFVRLWDDTNKIAVIGSEMNIENKIDPTYLLSPKLELWNGRNTYIVQIKSLNGAAVHYSAGKIKVSY